LRSSAIEAGVLTLVLNNTMAAIEDGRLAILSHLEPRDLSPRVINRLEVILEEVISNIVRHGFHRGSDQAIVLTVALTPSAIALTFEDDGTPFDPLSAPLPKPFTSLEDAVPGGQGLVLLRRLATHLRYERLDQPAAGAFRANNRLWVTIATTP
jgi:anti-sigma regulatory factor (Ser/Thr protein kinase)